MKGYTLIEVIISMLLLVIILVGGTALFYQSLKSSGFSDVDLGLTSSLRSVFSSIEKDIRFGQVVNVGTGFRLDCVSAGSVGFPGETLTVSDLVGAETVYSLDNNRIASTSSLMGNVVYISPPEIKIERLGFTWFCQGGVSDKIKVEIDAIDEVLGSGTGIGVTRKVSTDISMFNSGIN
jgi:prepilin-type N-terminal cleavage/methylation domain-containing protein